MAETIGFLRLRQVLAIFPVSRSTWLAGVKSGLYPPGIHLSARTTAWAVKDIMELLDRISRGEQ